MFKFGIQKALTARDIKMSTLFKWDIIDPH